MVPGSTTRGCGSGGARAISAPGPPGQRVRDDSFLLLFNASETDLKFAIPPARYGEEWVRVLDTALSAEPGAGYPGAGFVGPGPGGAARPGDTIDVCHRSLQVLRRA